MFDLITEIPFVSLFIKFMVASTVLLSAVWLMEKTRLINTPDLAELAWKLAIAGSFLALLPVADIMSSTYIIEDNETAALIEDLNENRPLSAFAAKPTSEALGANAGDAAPSKDKQSLRSSRGPSTEGSMKPQNPRTNGAAPVLRQLPEAEKQATAEYIAAKIKTAAEANDALNLTPENDSEGIEQQTFWYSAADLRTKDLAAMGWLSLALLTVGALMISYRDAVKNLGSRKRVQSEDKANQVLRAICEKADIRHVPYLSRSGAIKSPVCLPRKEICLPNWAFEDMPAAEFRSLLAHELGHMVRRDPVMLMALQILSRIFFFQPFFIIARKRLTDIAELAADEWAAKQAADSRAVANALFTCATKINETRQIQWGLAMAGNKSILKQRVERLLGAQSVPFKTAGTFAKTALGVGVIGLSLGLPSIEFAGAMSAEGPMNAETLDEPGLGFAAAPRVSSSVTAEVAAPSNATANVATTVAPMAIAHPRSSHRRYGQDDERGNISWSEDGEKTSLKWEGDFRLSDDDSTIIPEDEDSFLRLKTKKDGVRRSMKFEVEDGKRVHTYAVDGKKTELDDEGRKWLKTSIKRLVQSGFAAEQRVARILKKSKVKGVLKETSDFENDFVKRIYLSELMDQAKLKDKEISKVIDIVAKFDSDFEKRLTLSVMLEEENVSDKSLPKILKIAKGFDSDFEKRLLVSHYVSEMELTNKSTDLVIDIAESIDSDFELRLLLTTALHDTKLSDKNVQRILDLAIKNIDSDFEKRLLLTSFADEYDRSDVVVSKVLKAAATIDSNFERRLLLSTIVAQAKLNEENWLSAIDIANKIDSDFEKSQALMHFRAEIPKDNKKIVAALDKAMEGMDLQSNSFIEFSANSGFDFNFETGDFAIEFTRGMENFEEAMEDFAEEMAELEIEKAEIARKYGRENSEEARSALRNNQRQIREKQREMRLVVRDKERLMRQVERAKNEAAREIERELARVNRELRSGDKELQRELKQVLRDLERTKTELNHQLRFRSHPSHEPNAPKAPKKPQEPKEPAKANPASKNTEDTSV